jgi:HlyD family secretion protein
VRHHQARSGLFLANLSGHYPLFNLLRLYALSAPNAPLLPAALAQHTVESLYAEHGPARPWIYWLALLAVTAALVALPLVEVDVTVRAPGVVRPATERTELRVPISAQIAQVLARDNDSVTTGQPLLVLRSRDLDERLSLNRTRQATSSALVADLALLTSEVGSVIPDRPFDGPALQTPELAADHAQMRAQLAAQQLTVAKAARELARAEALAAKGLIAERDLDQARDDLADATAEKSTLLRSTRTRREARLRDERTTLAGLRTEENRLNEESMQTTVRAPVAGSIQGLTGLSPGAWLTAGQSIGAVSPADTLIVETFVSSKDVGLLKPGQSAHLQIDAYPYTQWGLLDATVTSLAADSNTTSPVGSITGFKVTLRPSKDALHLPNGFRGPMRKGMTVSARFIVTRRSLLQILHEDIIVWMTP